MLTKGIQYINKGIHYIRKYLSSKQFLIFSAILIGLSSGLMAILLKLFVHTISHFVAHYATTFEKYFLYTLFPLIGIGLTVFIVRRFFKTTFRKGSAEIVYAITKESSKLHPSQTISHVITSALTMGFGGSSGLESPIVSAGASVGSNYATTHGLDYKDRTLLLACGSAAGIGAAFNAPIAGVLFAIEVLLADVTASAFIPLIIASATGALLSKIILNEDILLFFGLQQPFDYYNVPFYVILGILAGIFSLYYTRCFTFVETKFKSIAHPYLKVLIGGILLSLLLIFFPPLYGEGYSSIKTLSGVHVQELLEGNPLESIWQGKWAMLLFVVMLLLVKVFATAFTLNSGGNGGNFAPSLCVGAYLGFAFSRFINLSGFSHIPESNFTIVAMAGIMSAVLHAPLTAIFLIVEITGGYGLMIPLMIVAALSNVVLRYFEPVSMEGKKLAEKLKFSVDSKDKHLLSRLDFPSMIENDFERLSADGYLKDLVAAISQSKRNIFPVLNTNEELVGIIHLDDVRALIFNHDLYETMTIRKMMTTPRTTLSIDENLHDVLTKFDRTNQWNLPVIENKKYVGFLSKSNILSKYRSELLKSV